MVYKMKGFPMHKGASPMKQMPPEFNITGSGASTTPTYEDTKRAKIREALKTHHRKTTGPEAMRPPKDAIVKSTKKPVIKKASKSIIKKALGRLIPYAGWALATHDVYKINQLMQEGMGLGSAIKKHYLDID